MIRVFIVDKVPLICDMLTIVLKDKPDIEVIGCASTVDEALPQLVDCHILLATTTLPNDGAYELTLRIAQSNLPAKILIIDLAESKEANHRYIEAGAAGYVHRHYSADYLLANIRAVHDDQAVVSLDFTSAIMARLAQSASSYRATPLRFER